MPRRRDDDKMEDEEHDADRYDDEEEEEMEGRSSRKRRRFNSIEDDGNGKKPKPKKHVINLLDLEAKVGSDEDEYEEEGEDDFMVDGGVSIPDEDGRRILCRPLLALEDGEEDVEEIERRIQARYARSSQTEYDEETTDVEQQAFLPSVRDPKLWMVKCVIGREREVAFCLMQKCIDRGSEIQIRSAVALDHLKNYVYIEADKEAHVKEAIKGLRNIYVNQKITLVPIREMTAVLSVESKAIDLSNDTWVRIKIGIYKGDLAKVVDVDNVRQRVTVKLIPRIDLQALANKLEGREVAIKKSFISPPRLMNVDEARELHICVERRKDPMTGKYFEHIDKLLFKDGFLYKTVSVKSISTQNINPTFDELEKFRTPGEKGESNIASLSALFVNSKKGHFMKGDAVIVVKGDLQNLKGWVEKVGEDIVHIRPEEKGLPKTLAVNQREVCKYFEPGNHVKVVSGRHEGATGMVVKVEQHVLIMLSDTTKEHISVLADNVVKNSEVTTGSTKVGNYELHDLVLLIDNTFGVIIRVESETFQVLKGTPDRSEAALVKLREIKCKLDKKFEVQDQNQNTISLKDVVKILDGPSKGKQGIVEHIYRRVVFVYDRHHHREHGGGFLCAKASSCHVVGGSRGSSDRNNGAAYSRFENLKTPV